jgi:hypothetical protein
MRPKNNRDYGRTATAMLATTYVLLTGLGVCLFIVLTNAERKVSWQIAAICVGGTLVLWLLSWLLRDRRSNSAGLTNLEWLGRKDEVCADVDYKPRFRRRRRSGDASPHQPPTVERIRELSENVKTWVPSRHRAERHRRDIKGR